jgi:hypothetical protein
MRSQACSRWRCASIGIVVDQREHRAEHQQRDRQCQQALDRQFGHRQLVGANDRHTQRQAQSGHSDAHGPRLQDHARREFVEHARVQAPAQPDAGHHLQRGLAGRQEELGADELVAGQAGRRPGRPGRRAIRRAGH